MSYEFSSKAEQDLVDIWRHIARDNTEAADRVEEAIYSTCESLANFPLSGIVRPDLTIRPVRFWLVQPYRNYFIVYDPETMPLRIIRILHGARNLPAILR